jgi:Domain of unknown function (DUF4917)
VTKRSSKFSDPVLSYEEVRKRIGKRTSYLLLGNGFSIACDPVFRYESLYEAAVKEGLSKRAQEVFGRLGTNNFEGVMRLLDDSHWVGQVYGLVKDKSEMLNDLETIKKTLIRVISKSHLPHPGDIEDDRKAAAAGFVNPYKIIFTTNYDLLLYWVAMFSGDPPPFQDCFRADEDDPDSEYLVFTERLGDQRGILFLHGALHFYLSGGELRKHSWIRSGKRLTELIQEGLDKGQYPLFVAEGTPDKKLEQIQGSGYLWYALEKLRTIQSPLVMFGHSLGDSDGHVLNVIAKNRKLPELYVSLHGDIDSKSNRAIQRAAKQLQTARSNLPGRPKPLEVFFYDSDSAAVWDPAE